jgi:hypothetical protein
MDNETQVSGFEDGLNLLYYKETDGTKQIPKIIITANSSELFNAMKTGYKPIYLGSYTTNSNIDLDYSNTNYCPNIRLAALLSRILSKANGQPLDDYFCSIMYGESCDEANEDGHDIFPAVYAADFFDFNRNGTPDVRDAAAVAFARAN